MEREGKKRSTAGLQGAPSARDLHMPEHQTDAAHAPRARFLLGTASALNRIC